MAGRRLLLSMFLGTVLFTGKAGAWDVFNVYAAKAPEGCLDKNIALTKEVSLIDLIKIGICNNPGLNVDYMSLKGAEADLGSARSEYFPNINLSAGVGKNTTKLQGDNSTENSPYNLNAGLSLLLYDFGGRSARIDSFRAYLAGAGFNYNSALQDLILSINTAYFKLLGAR